MSLSITSRSRRERTPERRERLTLSRGLDRVVRGPEGRGYIRDLYPIVRPAVARAVQAPLGNVQAVLLDESAVVPAPALAAVRRFLTDGAASPLYGTSIDAAVRAASSLEQAVMTGASA